MRRVLAGLRASLHLKPSFIIIGAMKAGTTSLYHYLVQHPCIAPARNKELRFFDHRFHSHGLDWYWRRFPTTWQQKRAGARFGCKIITGEASPYYLMHPRAPERVKKVLPQVKLIVVLRNPVDRTYSHYQHNYQRGDYTDPLTREAVPRETLSFEEAIACEEERLHGEEEKMLADEKYRSVEHQYHSYKARSIYVDQLQRWMQHFPREQFLILSSEELAARPNDVCAWVFKFLQLPAYELQNESKLNVGSYSSGLDAATRAQLGEYFKPHNARLYELLGRRFDWDT
ncbi:MAG TPA: sulfotransferase [Abditibacteriaceae bacterium]|jgi:hypothetical protein